MRRLVPLLVFLALLIGQPLSFRVAEAETSQLLHPIIAQLFAEPQAFSGHVIAIYGLVIETESSGNSFLLQDVSQRPLKIVSDGRVKIAVGDQLTIVGTFHANGHTPYLSARLLIPTRVTAGGGCC